PSSPAIGLNHTPFTPPSTVAIPDRQIVVSGAGARAPKGSCCRPAGGRCAVGPFVGVSEFPCGARLKLFVFPAGVEEAAVDAGEPFPDADIVWVAPICGCDPFGGYGCGFSATFVPPFSNVPVCPVAADPLGGYGCGFSATFVLPFSNVLPPLFAPV